MRILRVLQLSARGDADSSEEVIPPALLRSSRRHDVVLIAIGLYGPR
jgi:hypothetical protein